MFSLCWLGCKYLTNIVHDSTEYRVQITEYRVHGISPRMISAIIAFTALKAFVVFFSLVATVKKE